MWEIEISNILIELTRASPPLTPSVLPSSPTAAHPFFLPGEKHTIIRVGSMTARLLGATSRRVSRVRNVIAGHTRLHHTKSELLDELVNRGLVDQITRWVTNNPILSADPQTFPPAPMRFASTCVRLKQYTVGSTPPATHSTSGTSFP